MVYKRRELNIRHWIRRSGFGRISQSHHSCHVDSSGSKQKESTACKSKTHSPSEYFDSCLYRDEHQKGSSSTLLYSCSKSNRIKVIINSFAQDIRKRPDYSIRFLDYLSKHPNNTSCRDIHIFRFGSAFLGLMFFEADVVDADPYKRSTLLNVYMRFVEKQIKAMIVPV